MKINAYIILLEDKNFNNFFKSCKVSPTLMLTFGLPCHVTLRSMSGELHMTVTGM